MIYKSELEMLKEANDALRSCYSVISRKGEKTYWEGLEKLVKRLLDEQHSVLYPTKKQLRLRKLNKINNSYGQN